MRVVDGRKYVWHPGFVVVSVVVARVIVWALPLDDNWFGDVVAVAVFVAVLIAEAAIALQVSKRRDRLAERRDTA